MTLQELQLKNKLSRQRREREVREAAAAAAAVAESTKQEAEAKESKKGQRKGKKPPQREFLVVEPEAAAEQKEAEADNGVEAEVENPDLSNNSTEL